MEKIDLPFFYKLGSELTPLTKFTPADSDRIPSILASISIRANIDRLFSSFSTLTVSRKAGSDLLQSIDEAVRWWTTTLSKGSETAETDVDVEFKFNRLITRAKEFETVLNAELQTLAAYHVTQKGIYSTPDLIDRAENIFPPSALIKLSPEIIHEVRESGRCLAFDNATASAFHIMRATELMMHAYYIRVCKPKGKHDKRLASWGAYIAEFQKSEAPEVKEVVAILQQIKDRHRNLIMHPEVVLSPDEACTLFEIAQGVIIAMSDKLPKPKKK